MTAMTAIPRHTASADDLSFVREFEQGRIMLTHYSAENLFSDAARAGFVNPDGVNPDIRPIPPR